MIKKRNILFFLIFSLLFSLSACQTEMKALNSPSYSLQLIQTPIDVADLVDGISLGDQLFTPALRLDKGSVAARRLVSLQLGSADYTRTNYVLAETDWERVQLFAGRDDQLWMLAETEIAHTYQLYTLGIIHAVTRRIKYDIMKINALNFEEYLWTHST